MSEYPIASYIRFASFPMTLSKDGDILYKEIKAFVTDTHLIIVDNNRNPALIENLISLEGSTAKGYTVTTDVAVYSLFRSLGCACGSTLRSFNPYRGIPHVSQL